MKEREYPMGIDNYVSKFMDENGCCFEDACEELGISCETVFKQNNYNEFQ